ncbi:MAG: GTP 3',8-cyclase MoaA [Bacteroidetes bacterium]|nr:GTP 3',8-cyclase MoaA [Bacteroidota bacterium]
MQLEENNIVDQFGRVHDYLRISLTERCNLRCFYCMPEEGIALRPKAEFMNTDEVIRMAETFVSLGVKKIRITGGEPLVRSDAKQILEKLSKLPVELAITTNGILIDKFFYTIKTSGIRSINVSLDSLDKEKFNSITRRNDFDKVISNINLLLDENYHVKVNAVVIKGVNENEIVNFVQWTSDKNIHVRFIEFMPFDGNKWDFSKVVSMDAILSKVRERFGEKVTRISDRKNDTSKNYSIAGFKGTFAIISSVTNPFCDTCNRLRLTADGKIKNCLFSDSETDLLSAMRRGEDIVPLIRKSVWNKKEKLGGITSFENLEKRKNRAMISIGG